MVADEEPGGVSTQDSARLVSSLVKMTEIRDTRSVTRTKDTVQLRAEPKKKPQVRKIFENGSPTTRRTNINDHQISGSLMGKINFIL